LCYVRPKSLDLDRHLCSRVPGSWVGSCSRIPRPGGQSGLIQSSTRIPMISLREAKYLATYRSLASWTSANRYPGAGLYVVYIHHNGVTDTAVPSPPWTITYARLAPDSAPNPHYTPTKPQYPPCLTSLQHVQSNRRPKPNQYAHSLFSLLPLRPVHHAHRPHRV